MPFPKTYVEELIIEWLHLDGFLVEANLPVAVTSAGGRGEADVVGARVGGNILEIIHVETGTLAKGQDSIISVGKKFSSIVSKEVTNYFKQRFSFSGDTVNYQSIYVPSYWTRPTVKGIKGLDILVEPLPTFILERLLPAIKKWKSNLPHKPKGKGKHIALPESYWMLQLIDYLESNDLVKKSS
ncbi:MAG: hypothetical protein KAV83_10345 [Desulfobacterales bacterium]|nr:hypothetical protein [Desulfobacterales bacterium]